MNLLKNHLQILPIYKEKPSGIDIIDLSQVEKVESPSSIILRDYSLVEVEIAENPVGDDGEDWYRYVLVRGSSRITGYHSGTLSEVIKYANDCVVNINERNSYNKPKRPLIQSK